MQSVKSMIALPRDSCCWKVSGTETFRLRSKKILDRWGGNRQNIEASLRRIWIASPGYILLNRDQAGAEALIVAYLCRKGRYRSLFENNINPHVFTGLHIFSHVWLEIHDAAKEALELEPAQLKALSGWNELSALIKSSDNWLANKRYYFMSKKTGHGHNYDMRGNTFIMSMLEDSGASVVLSKKQGDDLLNARSSLFPEIKSWHTETQTTLHKTKMLHNLFGHPRIFTGIIDEHTYKEAYAFVPQSTVGQITNMAITKLQSFIEENNLCWNILANTHDGMLYEVPEEEADFADQKGEEFMNIELVSPKGEKFRMKSESKRGYNWAPYDKEKNPKGLK